MTGSGLNTPRKARLPKLPDLLQPLFSGLDRQTLQRLSSQAVVPLSLGLLVLLITAAGQAAEKLLATAGPFAQVSLGSGFWLAGAGLFVVFCDSLSRTRHYRGLLMLSLLLASTTLIALYLQGQLQGLALMQEMQNQSERFWREARSHILITLISVGLSCAMGLPLGWLAARRRSWEGQLFLVLNTIQTLPSLALFGLLIAPLAWLGHNFPALAVPAVGFGAPPTILALFLYGLLPVVRNTIAGLEGLSPAAVEAAQGMGMSGRQKLYLVELPLAVPVILAGVKTSVVINIGTATIGATIGAGGLGAPIINGLSTDNPAFILHGAAVAALFAIIIEGLLDLLERLYLHRQGKL